MIILSNMSKSIKKMYNHKVLARYCVQLCLNSHNNYVNKKKVKLMLIAPLKACEPAREH